MIDRKIVEVVFAAWFNFRSSRSRRSGKRPSAPLLEDIENENPVPDKKPMKCLNVEAADRPPPQPPRQHLQPVNNGKREDDLESVDSFWGVGGVGVAATTSKTSETPTGKPLFAERTPGYVEEEFRSYGLLQSHVRKSPTPM